MDLFANLDRYPQAPGWKSRDTARDAAADVAPKAPRLRGMVLGALAAGDLTADEIAHLLRVDKLSIRPRLSELSALGKVRDSGARRRNASGKNAVVWQAVQ